MDVLPDLETFKARCKECTGQLIPVCRRFLADTLSPVLAFSRLGKQPFGFLLESVERGERVGRYSFVGTDPEIIFAGHVLPEPTFRVTRPDGALIEEGKGDPMAKLEAYMASNVAAPPEPELGVPPFDSGAVGYLGYDIVRLFEPRLFKGPPVKHGYGEVPDVWVPVYRTIVAFDHVMNMVFVVHHADPRTCGAELAFDRAKEAIDGVVKRLIQSDSDSEILSEIPPKKSPQPTEAGSNMERSAYLKNVEQAKEYIAAGDIIQVVLSQRFSRSTKAHPFQVYRSLRAINPSPYMFYLRFPEVHLVGSSPEIMVVVEDNRITVRPIAGTRRRGKTAKEDAALAAELLADEKERAEHVMLLDLGRNDVGRVAKYDSIEVTEKMTIENYSHVMHIVSNVKGELAEKMGSFDVLRACHPAGTVSGAPKIRAMEIIDELEPDSRGPYAGAVGVMDFRGNMNTAIAIRTFIIQPKADGTYLASVQAGAGIVADSVPESEYEETRQKAMALLRSLDAAEVRHEA